jgi:uncharacterized membrane protein YoaT (DUF817 family)
MGGGVGEGGIFFIWFLTPKRVQVWMDVKVAKMPKWLLFVLMVGSISWED